MRKLTSRGSSLFLLELMISIVFFAIAAAGCVQVFAKAHTLSTEAEKLDQAVSIAQSLIEEKSGQNAESRIWYYDDQGNACDEGSAVYQAEVTVQTKEHMRQIRVVIIDLAKRQVTSSKDVSIGAEEEEAGEKTDSLENEASADDGEDKVTDGLNKDIIYQLETVVYCPGEADTQTGGGNE